MSDPTTAAEALAQAALEPKRVSVGAEEVEGHSLKDLRDAAKDEAANTQVRSAARLIFNKISPPGAA